MAVDMKTIKCMYGLGHGANSRLSWIYYNQERTKTIITTHAGAISALQKRGLAWESGLFSDTVLEKPVTHGVAVTRWKPILPIRMDRVHICTLHAQNRIIKKIMHLHFMFVWMIRDKREQKLAIDEMQRVLSTTGAHGGEVKILKDNQLSRNTNSVPNKPSFDGAHIDKLFKPSTLEGGSNRVWKDLVAAERNFFDDRSQRSEKFEIWQKFENLPPYLTSLSLLDEEINTYRTKIENWGQQLLRLFGKQHLTHYMVFTTSIFLSLNSKHYHIKCYSFTQTLNFSSQILQLKPLVWTAYAHKAHILVCGPIW